MGEGIKVGEIRKALKKNKDLATKPTESGGYPTKEEHWGVYDASLEAFARTFLQSLPNWTDLVDSEKKNARSAFKDYVEETLTEKEKRNLTAVEFGGPGSKLFEGFTTDFFSQTLGVCLKDIRDEHQKEQDKKLSHSVITGDILDPEKVPDNEVLIKVAETLGTNKIDLIISRLVGPLGYIDKNLAILDRIIRNWYSMLNENGLMFIQFESYRPLPGHNRNTTMIEKWATAISEKYPGIDIQVDGATLRLHKKTGSLEELPAATKILN